MKPHTHMAEGTSEYQRFDAALTKALSISKEALQRREAEWKKRRKRKKRAKARIASKRTH